jgi:hypothetical protein
MTEKEARAQWLAQLASLRRQYEAQGKTAQDAMLLAAAQMRREVGPLPGPDALGDVMVLVAQTAFAVGTLGAIPGALPALRQALAHVDISPDGARVLVDELAAALVDKSGPTWLGKQVARLGLRAFLGGVRMKAVTDFLNRYAPLLSGIGLAAVTLLQALGYQSAAKVVETIIALGGLGVVSPEMAGAITPFVLAGVTFYGAGRKLWALTHPKAA